MILRILVLATAVVVVAAVAACQSPEPTPSDEELAVLACLVTLEEPHDIVATATGHDGQHWRYEMALSIEDSHEVQTRMQPDGTVTYQREIILKDLRRYSREGSTADPSIYGPWSVHPQQWSPFTPLPCESRFMRTPDSDPPHFTSRYVLSDVEVTVDDEFWVDDQSRPTHARRTAKQSGGPAVVLEYVYSDYGVANPITAPLVPNATPMP